MRRVIDRWLWRGTFEPQARPLPVHTESRDGSWDLVSAYSSAVEQLQSQMEALVQAAERRAAAETSGNVPAAVASEQEIRQIAKGLLPGMDAIDRIVEAAEQVDRTDEFFTNWLISIKALQVRFRRILEDIGVVAISAVGSEVNFEIHDVVAVVAAGEYPPDTIVKEQQTGYYFRGKLLRDAKVIVAQ